jgi:hypothetical protein
MRWRPTSRESMRRGYYEGRGTEMETTGIEPANSWLQIERSSRSLVGASAFLEITSEKWATERRFPVIPGFYGEI